MRHVVLAVLSYCSILVGVLVWVYAANVDRIVNAGEALGFSLLFLGIIGVYHASTSKEIE